MSIDKASSYPNLSLSGKPNRNLSKENILLLIKRTAEHYRRYGEEEARSSFSRIQDLYYYRISLTIFYQDLECLFTTKEQEALRDVLNLLDERIDQIEQENCGEIFVDDEEYELLEDEEWH